MTEPIWIDGEHLTSEEFGPYADEIRDAGGELDNTSEHLGDVDTEVDRHVAGVLGTGLGQARQVVEILGALTNGDAGAVAGLYRITELTEEVSIADAGGSQPGGGHRAG